MSTMKKNHHEAGHGKLKSYVIGFILSIVLTLIPYFLVVNHIVTGWVLIAIILSFAVLQMLVQLLFFLHLGQEEKPRWNFWVLVSFVSIILIVVVGTLLIIHNLNYNMTPMDMGNYMMQEEGMQK